MRTVPVYPDIEPAMHLLRARGVEHAASATAAGAVAAATGLLAHNAFGVRLAYSSLAFLSA